MTVLPPHSQKQQLPQPPATILNGGGWVRQGGDTWVFPHRPRLTSPTPLSFGIMPFSSFTLHCRNWLWFILIDVRVYMMPNYNVPDSTIYHRQLSPLPKHTQPNRIDGGAFSFSSSPRLITIYTSCKRGQNWGVTCRIQTPWEESHASNDFLDETTL